MVPDAYSSIHIIKQLYWVVGHVTKAEENLSLIDQQSGSKSDLKKSIPRASDQC